MKQIAKKYIKEKIFGISILIILVGIKVLLALGLPLVLQKYIDYMPKKIVATLLHIAIIYFCAYFLLKVISIYIRYVSDKVGWSFFNKVRVWVISRFIKYDNIFFVKYSIGELMEYTERDINVLYNFCTCTLVDMIFNMIVVLGIIAVSLAKSIVMGMLFLVYVTISFYIIYKTISAKKYSLDEYTSLQSRAIGKYSEWLVARKDINTLGGFEYIDKKNRELDHEYKLKEIGAQKYLYRIWSVALCLVAVGEGVLLFVNGRLYLMGLMSIGTVYLMYSYGTMLKVPFENLQVQLQMLTKAINAYKRMCEVISYKSEVSVGNVALSPGQITIEADGLCYTYQNANTSALEDISFKINAREVIGIKGESGSGKSTLCKLICKMIEPTKGNLLINGTKICDISLDSLRERIVFLSTNSQLMDGTIRENILLFNEDVADDEITKALDECIVLPYLTSLGTEFLDLNITQVGLSEGQKQIINISRLLFIESGLIILDEATSRMDASLQICINNIVNKLREDSTIIIVSHDSHSLETCDRIMLFEKSKLVEIWDKE